MELKSCTYATVTTLGDFGPWISKVVLDLPCAVRTNDIDASTFHIYVERHERTGEVLMRKERGADMPHPPWVTSTFSPRIRATRTAVSSPWAPMWHSRSPSSA